MREHIRTTFELLHKAETANSRRKTLDYLYEAIVAITAAITELESPEPKY